MKNYTYRYVIALLCLVLPSCRGGGNGGGNAPDGRFPYVEIPSYVSEAGSAEYLVTNFWNRYFATPGQSCDSLAFEQAFTEYLAILINAPAGIMEQAQDSLLEKAERAGKLKEIAAACDRYLFGTDSPYRNEDCYIPVLHKVAASPQCDSAARVQARHHLPLISLNRKGSVAADFTYTLRNGRTGRMHDIEADRLIMFFSNPGCTSCKEIIDALSSSEAVQRQMAEGRLKVLNLYPDADLGEWYGYMPHYPKEWINAFDAEGIIRSDSIYYLRAIPSLYLLDREKRVICKDAPLEMLMQAVNRR